MPQPITRNIVNDDLSGRFTGTSTIVASPQLAAETIIASVNVPNFGDTPLVSGVRLQGMAAFTVGTSGVSATLRLRKTDVNGTVVVSSGALTVTAGNLYCPSILSTDAQPGVGTYVLTLQIGSGAAASTVSAVHISITMI